MSKAGKVQGMSSETRSGLAYQVLRIMEECRVYGNQPKVLIMENVVDLIQAKFIRQFNDDIQQPLAEMGYTNYVFKMNAKDYGVPQNRDRVFMVSILGEYYYETPKPFPLVKRLKDCLEKNVPKKYYLSSVAIEGMKKTTFNQSKESSLVQDENGISATLCARDYKSPKCIYDYETKENYIQWDVSGKGHKSTQDRAYYLDGVMCAIPASNGGDKTQVIEEPFLRIPEDTIKGFAEAFEGDGVYLDRPHQKRGVVQSQMIQTIKTTVANNVGVVVNAKEELCNKLLESGELKEYDMIRHSYTADRMENENARLESSDGTSATLTTRPDTLGVVVNDEPNYLRIRKLTPLECWRVMDIDDYSFMRASKFCSNAQLYKQCGNGIVIGVFAQILLQMKEK